MGFSFPTREDFTGLLGYLAWLWHELFLPICAVTFVALFGTLGFYFIEGWSLFDSLYMTVITLTTTGFNEVHPLSPSGRAFTILLLVVGVVVVTAVITSVTQNLLQRHFSQDFQRKKVMDQLAKLTNHTIVCGYGRLARIVADELKRGGTSVIIVERDEARAKEAEDDGHLVSRADASSEETLLQVGIARAKNLISLLPKDADNLYVILTAREISSDLYILSRAEDAAGEKRLRRAGASRVISPYRVGGQKIAEGILKPYVSHFLELAFSASDQALQIEEIKIPEHSPLNGTSLQDSAIRQRANVIVAAIIAKDGVMSFNPASTTIVEGGSTFIALGTREALSQLEAMLLQG